MVKLKSLQGIEGLIVYKIGKVVITREKKIGGALHRWLLFFI